MLTLLGDPSSTGGLTLTGLAKSRKWKIWLSKQKYCLNIPLLVKHGDGDFYLFAPRWPQEYYGWTPTFATYLKCSLKIYSLSTICPIWREQTNNLENKRRFLFAILKKKLSHTSLLFFLQSWLLLEIIWLLVKDDFLDFP